MDWYKDWTKNENEKKRKNLQKTQITIAQDQLRQSFPKCVWGGGQTLGH